MSRAGAIFGLLGCANIALAWQSSQAAGLEAESPAAIFASGQQALAAGQLDSAESDFRAVLAIEPQSLPALANLGVVSMRRRNWPEALARFRRAQELAPNNPGLALNIGLAYFHEGKYDAAAGPFRTVLTADPASVQARYLLGLCEFANEKYKEAVAHLEPLWETQNGQLTYLYVLALSANKAKADSLEKQALERMYAVGNNTAEYHLFLGRSWLLRQRDEDALKEFAEAARLDPHLPFVHYSIGSIFASTGKYAQAKSEFLADLANEPDLALDHEELGTVCLKLNQTAEAKQHFRRAVELDSNLPRSYLALAKIEKAEHHPQEALADLDAAGKLDNQSASLHYLRAQTLQQLGRTPEAKAEFAESAHLRQSTRDRLEEQVSSNGGGVDAQIGLPQR